MDHKGLKLRQWGGEGKTAKMKFGKLSFLWFAQLFASLSRDIFFRLCYFLEKQNTTKDFTRLTNSHPNQCLYSAADL